MGTLVPTLRGSKGQWKGQLTTLPTLYNHMEAPTVFTCSLELAWEDFLNSSLLAFLGSLLENLPRPVVYNPGLFCTPGIHLAMSEDTFLFTAGGGRCNWCLGDRAQGCCYPTIYRTAPITKNYLAQNVNSAKIENFI